MRASRWKIGAPVEMDVAEKGWLGDATALGESRAPGPLRRPYPPPPPARTRNWH